MVLVFEMIPAWLVTDGDAAINAVHQDSASVSLAKLSEQSLAFESILRIIGD